MLQELKFKNYKSFKDEVSLSFEATEDTSFEDHQVVEVEPGVRLLRFAMVYGPNASGKSNLLDAIDFLRRFFFTKANDNSDSTGSVPFKLDAATTGEPSEFTLTFYAGGTKYCYQLRLTQHQVLSEQLHYYESSVATMLFDRELKDGQSVIAFNPNTVAISAAAKEEISLKCLPNMSVFAARNQVNISIEKVDDAQEWLRKNLLPVVRTKSDIFNYASKKMYDNGDLKVYLLDSIHQADFNISDIKSDKVPVTISKDVVDMILSDEKTPDNVKERLKDKHSFSQLQTMFEHTVHNERGTETYLMSKESQSEGTKRTIGLEAVVYESMKYESFLPIDEIEASLHPELVEYIVHKFLSRKNRSQMLVTTHYDYLLNSVGDDLFRSDSIWFTNKMKNGSTDLFSLVEFEGTDQITSLQRAYRNGVFGALPIIKG